MSKEAEDTVKDLDTESKIKDLKVKAYDLIASMEAHEKILRKVNDQIIALQKEKPCPKTES